MSHSTITRSVASCTEALPHNGFDEVVILQLTGCPNDTCDLPAEVIDRFVLRSTDGPIEHLTTRCLARHLYTRPVHRLANNVPRDVPRDNVRGYIEMRHCPVGGYCRR